MVLSRSLLSSVRREFIKVNEKKMRNQPVLSLRFSFSPLVGFACCVVLVSQVAFRTEKSRYERNWNEQGPWFLLFRSVLNARRLCVGPFRSVSVFGTAREIPP